MGPYSERRSKARSKVFLRSTSDTPPGRTRVATSRRRGPAHAISTAMVVMTIETRARAEGEYKAANGTDISAALCFAGNNASFSVCIEKLQPLTCDW